MAIDLTINKTEMVMMKMKELTKEKSFQHQLRGLAKAARLAHQRLTDSFHPKDTGDLTRKPSSKVRMLNKPHSGANGVLREGVVLNITEVYRGQPVGDLMRILNINGKLACLSPLEVGIAYHQLKVGPGSRSFG